MKMKFSEKSLTYDGSQLRSLYNYLEHDLLGDSILAWRGPCHVSLDHMVDGEDLRARSKIIGDDMVHFLMEFFHQKLVVGVALQRLLSTIVKEIVEEREPAFRFKRKGDDLYHDGGKFNISIATASPVSVLIHYAVNVVNRGTPVKTVSLEDFNFPPMEFIHEVLRRFSDEWKNIQRATCKVRWVK